MLSRVLREHNGFFHLFDIRDVQRLSLDVQWTESLGALKFQVLSFASFLLRQLPVLVYDLSQ